METILSSPSQNSNNLEKLFEEQFNVRNRQRFDSYGGNISVADISLASDCQAQPDQTPVLFAHGYMANMEGFKATMKAYAMNGYRVIGLDHSIGAGLEHPDIPLHGVMIRKAADLLTLEKELGLYSYDLLAHSEGFIIGSVASYIHALRSGHVPARIIMGVSPAGIKSLDLEDVTRGPEMILKGATEMIHNPNRLRIALDTGRCLLRNGLGSLSEGLSLIGTDVVDMVNELSDQTTFVVVLVPKDEVISARKLQPVFEEGQINVAAVTTVASHNFGHAAILNDPITIRASMDMLEATRRSLQVVGNAEAPEVVLRVAV